MSAKKTEQLKNGTILDDRYVIRDVLGEGGFGRTYAAENLLNDERVAVKEYLADDRERFLKEARTLRDFGGFEGIVRVYDYFEEEGTAYLVMELLKGETLKRHVSVNGRMEPEEILRKMPRLLKALEVIHKAGVVHRDISPDNIMLSPEGTLTLLDFGAARSVENGVTHSVIYKDGYAPREQMDQKGKLGPWTDLYSLCATIWFCVTGYAPQDAVQRILHDELKAPSDLGVAMDPAAEALIMKGLRLRPESRWQDAGAFCAELMRIYPERDEKAEAARAKRKKRLFAAAAAFVLCLMVGAGFWYRENETRIRFGNIPTETVYLRREELPDRDYEAAALLLKERAERFAGQRNYLFEKDSEKLTLTFPLSVFENEDPAQILADTLFSRTEEGSYEPGGFSMYADWVVDWEDPSSCLFPGAEQKKAEEITGKCCLVRYNFSEGGRAALMSTVLVLKDRLDAAELPYAFGLDACSESSVILKVPGDKCRGVYLTTLAYFSNAYVQSAYGDEIKMITPADDVDVPDGNGQSMVRPRLEWMPGQGLRVNFDSYDAELLREVLDGLEEEGETGLFYSIASGNYPVLGLTIREARGTLEEGFLLFDEQLLDENPEGEDMDVRLGQYLIASLWQDPQLKKMDVSAIRLLDEDEIPVSRLQTAEELPFSHTAYMRERISPWEGDLARCHRELAGGKDASYESGLRESGTYLSVQLADCPSGDFPVNALEEIKEYMADGPYPGDGLFTVRFQIRKRGSDEDSYAWIYISKYRRQGLSYDFGTNGLTAEEMERADAFLSADSWYASMKRIFD